MNDIFAIADDLGPAKVIHIHNAETGLRAILVVDNVAAGPSIGGARMALDATLEECARLARAMTLKNAAAGLPHGGGKSVIIADPGIPEAQKEELLRTFARAIGQITDYIVGPDMGTNERCMGWAHDEIGRAVGLPREIGGIPLDEIGATGIGVAVAAEAAEGYCDVRIEGARVAVQGFGAVGYHSARFLTERGALLVAASDSRGCIIDSDGLDIDALAALKAQNKSVADLGKGRSAGRDAVIAAECDILIPAARPDVINGDNVADVKAKLVLEGANIPATIDAELELHRRGILVVPDFIANAGGVICASVEYHGGSEAQAILTIKEKIQRNTAMVLARAKSEQSTPRAAANVVARERVQTAQSLRRFG